MQESDEREPGAPQQHLVHILHVNYAKYEDELVEHIVPELVLNALRFGHAQLAEDQSLHPKAEYCKRTVCYVDQGLEQRYRNVKL